ncbi:MAG: HD domain-containing protein [candidate division WOR-3 bacterium]|nr:HD domain-containing protein [candidate division WOR-3 bacterium]
MQKNLVLAKLLADEKLRSVFKELIHIINSRKIYLVGGAIRDVLLNHTPVDFDFAVSGSGIEFARKFSKKIKGSFVLLSHEDDSARVVIGHKQTDEAQIIFDFNGFGNSTIDHDLRRRDFTINALAINLRQPTRIIDKFSGLRHLKQRKIVSVSNTSLADDPLRILRAFRLALELNFSVNKKILTGAKKLNLTAIAPERISYELLRICEQPKSFPYIKILYQTGLMNQLFPLASKLFADVAVMQHSLRTYQKLEMILHKPSFFSQYRKEFNAYFSAMPFRRALLKLAGLFHDVAKPHTQFETEEGDIHFYGHDNLGAKIVQRIASENLRLSRKQTIMLKTLIAYHMRLHLLATAPTISDRAIRRFFRDLGDEYLGLMMLTYADGYATARKTQHLELTITRMMQLKHTDESKPKIKRLVNGDDLIALGYKPGPIFKTILQELEDLQLEGKITTKAEGLEYVKTNFPKSI